jgi:hypothetical protein
VPGFHPDKNHPPQHLDREVIAMAGMLHIRRIHGAFSGFLLALLGIWGAVIPFIGPYFHYAYTPDKAWTYNTGRLWLEILPGAAVFLAGLLLMAAASRPLALLGALLGIAGGAWFAVGNSLAPLWTTANPAGQPASATALMRAVEQIGFFTGLGAAIVLFAAMAAGRLTAVPGVVASPVVPDGYVPAEGRTGSRKVLDTTETVPVETVPSEDTESVGG